MTQRFEGPGQDDEFEQWRKKNQEGFYLNKRKIGEVMLHHVDCKHLGNSEGANTTISYKIAAATREALLGEVRRLKLSLRVCSDCKPDEDR
ncbi:MAG TPA: hypothetical protein VGE07_10535 [Herpetosiphonaceae bacterium]